MASDVTIPHFDLPFRFGVSGGHAAVVQQDSVKDVSNCVLAVVATQAGTRLFVPDFGIDDPTFSLQPIQTSGIEQQIIANEPRAEVTFTSLIDVITATKAILTAEVTSNV